MAVGAFQTELLVKTLSEMPLGARLARFWNAPMAPVTSRERPGAPRERPNDVPERLRSLSGASPERPGSAPRRARALQGRPGASRGRFGVRFGGQIGPSGIDFRTVLLRVHTMPARNVTCPSKASKSTVCGKKNIGNACFWNHMCPYKSHSRAM